MINFKMDKSRDIARRTADAAIGTYRSLQRHRAVFVAIARLSY